MLLIVRGWDKEKEKGAPRRGKEAEEEVVDDDSEKEENDGDSPFSHSSRPPY